MVQIHPHDFQKTLCENSSLCHWYDGSRNNSNSGSWRTENIRSHLEVPTSSLRKTDTPLDVPLFPGVRRCWKIPDRITEAQGDRVDCGFDYPRGSAQCQIDFGHYFAFALAASPADTPKKKAID